MARVGEGKGVLEALLGRVQEFDEGYSDKIAAMYQDKGPVGQVAGDLLGGTPSFKKADMIPDTAFDRVIAPAAQYVLPAVNAVPKYVLPAAGVTLAGKGLIDIANAINAQLGDRQENGQIPLM